MNRRQGKSAIETVAQALRNIILDAEPGAMIGGEEALIERLSCSRSTVRQVARLLEREGLLTVRRGINGGYFGARPNVGTIEHTVSAYLETLHIDPRETTVIATALWVVAVRKAATQDRATVCALVDRLRRKVRAVKDNTSFAQIRALERHVQEEIFSLVHSPYIQLIFDVNISLSARLFVLPRDAEGQPESPDFVSAWREAKLIEFSAIASGDEQLAGVAAQHSREVWLQRLRQRYDVFDKPAT